MKMSLRVRTGSKMEVIDYSYGGSADGTENNRKVPKGRGTQRQGVQEDEHKEGRGEDES
jgi:hypothetical protein